MYLNRGLIKDAGNQCKSLEQNTLIQLVLVHSLLKCI